MINEDNTKPYFENPSDDENQYTWWNDEATMAQLSKRSADLDSRKDKGVTWEDLKVELLKRNKFNGLLDKAGAMAANNGLTEEKLNILLSEEN